MRKLVVWILGGLLLLLLYAELRESRPAKIGVVINEVLVQNRFTYFDEDEHSSDWLEIYNGGARTVDLEGYGLSDDAKDPHKWVFPKVVLPGGEFVLIWCSGKNRRSADKDLHTNFRLGRLGQTILISAPDGELLDALVLTPQTEDRSYGRSPNSSGDFYYHLRPTPREPNAGPTSRETIASHIELHPPGGFFRNPIDVEMSNPLPVRGIEIRYTTNGAKPTSRSLAYREAITLEPNEYQAGAVIRAAAFWGEERVTPIETHSYFWADDYQLPIISMAAGRTAFRKVHLGSRSRGRSSEREGYLEIFDGNGLRAAAAGMGLRLHGVGSRYGGLSTKKSYRVYFRDIYGDGKLRYRVIPDAGMDVFDRLVLRANTEDAFRDSSRATYIRDQLMRELSGDMGNLTSHGTWFNLFVDMDYHGVFNVVERMDRFFFSSYFPDEDAPWDVVNGGKALEGDLNAWSELISFFSRSDLRDETLYERASGLIDLESYTDHMILNIWVQNHDWPHKNFFAAKPRRPNAKWTFICWDGEFGFGLYPTVFDADTFTRALTRGGSGIGAIFASLLRNPQYQMYFLDRFQHHTLESLRPENVLARVENLRVLIGPDIQKEILLMFPERGFNLWEQNVDQIKVFARNRSKAIWNHIFSSPWITLPRVASVNPSKVVAGRETEIELKGYGFTAETQVYFNDVSAPVVSRSGPQAMKVLLPLDPGMEGTPDITASNPGNTGYTSQGLLSVSLEP
jgi:hypothetical protein